MQDRWGLELTTSSSAARDAYVETIDSMLAADAHVASNLNETLEADPDFALAHAAQARNYQLYGQMQEAKAAADKAADLAKNATRREQQHVEIIHRLVTGKMPEGFALIQEHTAEFPRDAFVLNPACGVFGLIGFGGRVGREAEQLAFIEPYAQHYGDDWWFQTVHAFALLETGQWQRGIELAESALKQRPSNPHGAHTLAHALFEAGDDQSALSYLTNWIKDLSRDSLLHCHLWWHQALLLLMTGEQEAGLQALKENCLPGATTSPSINVFTDSVAYLWRSELAGAKRQPELWAALLDYYQAQFRQPIVFVDAHIGFVYAALGQFEELKTCIEELEKIGNAGFLPAGTTAASLTRAYLAFAQEDWPAAIEAFEATMTELVRIGGSRAQRDLQTNTLIAAYVNADRNEDALRLVAQNSDRQPSRPVVGFDLV